MQLSADSLSKKLAFSFSHTTFSSHAVREFVNKSAASAASPDYVRFQAVIKSAASAASLRGGRASGRLDHGFFCAIFGRASGPKKYQEILKISDSVFSKELWRSSSQTPHKKASELAKSCRGYPGVLQKIQTGVPRHAQKSQLIFFIDFSSILFFYFSPFFHISGP